MMNLHTTKSITILMLLSMLSGSAFSRENSSVTFPESINLQSGHRLNLRGTGLLRYKLVFKAYEAALYLENDKANAPLDDVPKQLTIHYFWDIEKEAFADAAIKQLKKQYEKEKLAQVMPQINAFHELCVDIKKGDQYHLRYEPGYGTEVLHNNKRLGAIQGKAFAKAYFGLWLGPKPLSEPLKKQLLKQ
jgi:hypothetical protein